MMKKLKNVFPFVEKMKFINQKDTKRESVFVHLDIIESTMSAHHALQELYTIKSSKTVSQYVKLTRFIQDLKDHVSAWRVTIKFTVIAQNASSVKFTTLKHKIVPSHARKMKSTLLKSINVFVVKDFMRSTKSVGYVITIMNMTGVLKHVFHRNVKMENTKLTENAEFVLLGKFTIKHQKNVMIDVGNMKFINMVNVSANLATY